jgi:hypothetical protein
MIKARDEWTIVYGGPGNSLNESFIFPSYWQKNEIRKEKIKKIFNDNRKEK